jgi:hypothetical protein
MPEVVKTDLAAVLPIDGADMREVVRRRRKMPPAVEVDPVAAVRVMRVEDDARERHAIAARTEGLDATDPRLVVSAFTVEAACGDGPALVGVRAYIEAGQLADTVCLVSSGIAGTLVVQRGDVLDPALAVAETDQERFVLHLGVVVMVFVVVLIVLVLVVAVVVVRGLARHSGGSPRTRREGQGKLECRVLGQNELSTAAVDRDSRPDDDPPVGAIGVRMALDVEPAYDSPSVQQPVVQAVVREEVLLLAGEVARCHVLAGEVAIAFEDDRATLALATTPTSASASLSGSASVFR